VTCSRCGEAKPRTQFYLSLNTRSGLLQPCRTCRAIYYRRRYAALKFQPIQPTKPACTGAVEALTDGTHHV
jgi:hypothetical protein